jgi:membrane associated rhomboid family serine protease
MALFNSIWDDLKYSLRTGNMITKLAVVNFAIFVIAKLAYLVLGGFTLGNPESLYVVGLDYFCIPASLQTLLWQPWSLITHMFLHDAFWHLFNNLVGLYIFGSIVSDLIGDRRVLPLYLLGGLAGGVFFILSAQLNVLSTSAYALGASGAVMAMGGAALILAPDYRVPLLLLGAVKVKYIVLVLVLLDLTAIAGQYDSGGPIAHIAGFVVGCLFVYQLRDGRDWAESMNNLFARVTRLFSRKPASKKTVRKNKPGPMRATFVGGKGGHAQDSEDYSFQERLDAILDKIKLTGYESLSQEEKDFLYEASQK